MNIYQILDEHEIPYTKFEHEAVFDCDAADALGLNTQGVATKNLFLRDKKGKRHFLVVVQSDKALNLKALGELVGAKGVSFGSPDRLLKHLSTTPGSVSVLDILKEEAVEVELILDQTVADSEMLQCHPYTNTATLDIPLEGIKKLLASYGRSFKAIQL